ncbi:hypothetical protein CGCF413_v006452 [Colletotrichum fructicola]|nr:hypothetical protein CGCF413_v006452 [Colletotrichum fructicola]
MSQSRSFGGCDTCRARRIKCDEMHPSFLMSTLVGDPIMEERYFLEAEKFIKLRGLGQKTSRKVRLLHQCYVFERLMYESTCMRAIDCKRRKRVCNDVESVSPVPYPEDGMALRPPDWQTLDKRVFGSNNPGPIDADSEILGLAPDAIYSRVSGLPEHWLLLILHTIALGKEKDNAEQNAASGTLNLEDVLSRARTLEECINQHVTKPSQYPNRAGTILDGQPALENVLDGFSLSLQIYFHRRIYDVGTSWLQDKVVKGAWAFFGRPS